MKLVTKKDQKISFEKTRKMFFKNQEDSLFRFANRVNWNSFCDTHNEKSLTLNFVSIYYANPFTKLFCNISARTRSKR